MGKIGAFYFILFLLLFQIDSYGSPTDTSSSGTNTTINSYNNTLEIFPAAKTVVVPPGNDTTSTFNLTSAYPGNTGSNATALREGGVADWITFDGVNATDVFLDAGETKAINFTVSVPPATSSGLYYANITANSSIGETMEMNLTINVTEDAGKINVTVKDTLGTRLTSASVLIWDLQPVLRDSGSTDSNGDYLSAWLVPGNYSVEAAKAGYAINSENATVRGDQNLTYVTVVLEPTGAPILDVSPSSISETAYTGDTVQRTLLLSNTGDLGLVNVTLSSNVSWIGFNMEFVSSISPGNYESVYAYLGPISNVGVYSGTIFVNSSNNGDETITTVFDVKTRPSEPSDGGTVTPSSGIAPTIIRDIEVVSYPEELSIMLGETKLFSIEIKNTGNAVLRDVSLSVVGPFSVNVSPTSAEILSNFTKIFLVSIDIPKDAELKIYNFLATVSGGGVSDIKSFSVEVVPIRDEAMEEVIGNEIDELRDILNQIWRETVQLGSEGYVVDDVFSLLQNATLRLNSAEGAVLLGKYDAAKVDIQSMRSLAESAVNYITGLTRVTVVRRTIPWGYLAAAGTLVFALIAIILYQMIYFKGESLRKDRIYKALLTTFNFSRKGEKG